MSEESSRKAKIENAEGEKEEKKNKKSCFYADVSYFATKRD